MTTLSQPIVRTNIIQVVKLTKHAKLPIRATSGSVGFDIAADACFRLEPNNTSLISTGLIIAMPLNFYGELKGRSSMILKGIEVKTGVIDGVSLLCNILYIFIYSCFFFLL